MMSDQDTMQVSPAERRMIETVRAGRGLIVNINFGWGVTVRELTDGRISLTVNESMLGPDYDGPAVRSFMSGIVSAWSQQLQSKTNRH